MDGIAFRRRIDRIAPLSLARSYPGTDYIDLLQQFPQNDQTELRFWILTPGDAPDLTIQNLELPPSAPDREHWHDYGTHEIEGLGNATWSGALYLSLRFYGMEPGIADLSYLLITDKFKFDPRGKSLDEVQRLLWGIPRRETGRTIISPSNAAVGEPVEFTATYSAGSAGLAAGALIRFAVPKIFSTPQVDSDHLAGFVSLNGEGMPEVLSCAASVESHRTVDIIVRLKEHLLPRRGFTISYSSQISFYVPSRQTESYRRYWWSLLPPLAAAVAIDTNHPFVELSEENSHGCEYMTGPAARLHLFLPGRRKQGEPIELKGVFTDTYSNLPPSSVSYPDYSLFLESASEKAGLERYQGRLVSPYRFVLPLGEFTPGIYRVCAYNGESIVCRSNPMEIIDAAASEENIYWGEIHGHTNMSDGDGDGDFDELLRHARDGAALDFGAAADHSEYFTDNEWSWMRDMTNTFNCPGTFVTLNGYEWSGREGHRNIYTSERDLLVFRGRADKKGSISVVWNAFHGNEKCAGASHAPLAHGIVWENHDPDVERFIEVYSVWGASDSRSNPLVPQNARKNASGMTVHEILASGARLGFTGGGDCHEGRIGLTTDIPGGQGMISHGLSPNHTHRSGLTGALLPRLDRLELIRALRERRTYATTGARILLTFNIKNSDGVIEGKACVHAVNPLLCVDVIKNGNSWLKQSSNSLDIELEWQDTLEDEKPVYYYLRAEQADGHMAWSSPQWSDE
jgi:hypothetical protein